MTRDAKGDQARYSSGLYGWLRDREEQAAAAGGVLSYPETGTSYTGLPDRLARLRAGCSVSMCVGDLPPHARVGLDLGWVHRATVSPSGEVTLSVDDGHLWAAGEGV